MQIGIYGISTQTGMAFLADFLSQGHQVIGYARPTPNGESVVNAITTKKGIMLVRPINQNLEPSRFVSLKKSAVTHNLNKLINDSDLIIIPVPSHFHLEAIIQMVACGLKEKNTPIILSPSRTFATPYLWQILGSHYPVACFSTSPYSSKSIDYSTVLIKRRKRTWVISLEGTFVHTQKEYIENLFPQAAISQIPALTSLNNIGAIFHPTAYLLNYEIINEHLLRNIPFSFYIEGIARNEKIGDILESIDQIRLQIANILGLETFGLLDNPREETWRKLIQGLRALEEEHENEITVLRNIRKQFLEYINNCVLSAQHWLDITYGVERIPGENLCSAIGRTPIYQKNSYPQLRYIEEDIPTGLVPLEAIAKKLNIPHSAISQIINLYDTTFNKDARSTGRNLDDFSIDYIKSYLKNCINE
jgi:opine dehydrogenase